MIDSFHALNTQNMKPETVSPIIDTEGATPTNLRFLRSPQEQRRETRDGPRALIPRVGSGHGS